MWPQPQLKRLHSTSHLVERHFQAAEGGAMLAIFTWLVLHIAGCCSSNSCREQAISLGSICRQHKVTRCLLLVQVALLFSITYQDIWMLQGGLMLGGWISVIVSSRVAVRMGKVKGQFAVQMQHGCSWCFQSMTSWPAAVECYSNTDDLCKLRQCDCHCMRGQS